MLAIMFITLRTAVKGAVNLSIAIVAFRYGFPDANLSWWLLSLGIPCHMVADYTGFVVVFYAESFQKVAHLNRCYMIILLILVATGLIFGVWAAGIVFLEMYLFSLPGGARQTVSDLDSAELKGIDPTEWLR